MKWISVKDKLPETDEERRSPLVLVWVRRPKTVGWHSLSYFYHGEWDILTGQIDVAYGKRITHWMPLPEGPKEEDNGMD